MIFIFSGFIILGLYLRLNETAKVTEVTLKNEETTSSIKATTSTTKTTIKETTKKETTSIIETTTTTVLPGDPECEELGCPYGTNFVGSKNSDKYHYCSCSYAKSINRTNLVCFNSTEEAEEKGYTQSSCQPSSSTTSSTSTSTTSIESSATTTITTSISASTSITTSTTTIPIGDLVLNVIVKVNPIVRGNNQTIITEITDGSNTIENAMVNVTVKYVSDLIKECGTGLTNSSGVFVCSWKIGGSSTPGIFNVTSIAIKEGYASGTGSTMFEVIQA